MLAIEYLSRLSTQFSNFHQYFSNSSFLSLYFSSQWTTTGTTDKVSTESQLSKWLSFYYWFSFVDILQSSLLSLLIFDIYIMWLTWTENFPFKLNTNEGERLFAPVQCLIKDLFDAWTNFIFNKFPELLFCIFQLLLSLCDW